MQLLHQGSGAGSVISTLHLSLGLARAGVEIHFVCPPASEVAALAREAGLTVHELALARNHRAENARSIASLARTVAPDLFNSQSAKDREALAWLGLLGRLPAPFVATRRQMPRSMIWENWLASRTAARMIAVSDSVAAALVRRGTPRHKIRVVPNGVVLARLDRPVTLEEREQWRARAGAGDARRIIGVVARPKEQHVVLEALGQVETPVRLVLAGAEGHFGAAISRVPARHAVVALPFDPEVRPLYDLLEVALLPSASEGLSQSLLEALALGKPVVASDVAANRGVIEPGVDGLLVPGRDPRAWAAAIERLLRDPAYAARLGAAGMAKAREGYSLEQTVRGTVAVYQEVLAG